MEYKSKCLAHAMQIQESSIGPCFTKELIPEKFEKSSGITLTLLTHIKTPEYSTKSLMLILASPRIKKKEIKVFFSPENISLEFVFRSLM